MMLLVLAIQEKLQAMERLVIIKPCEERTSKIEGPGSR